MRLKPPVFVVGCPRSGTTLLYHLLLSAGGFAIYRTEVKAFTYLAPLAGGFRDQRKTEKFLQKWLCSEDFLRSGLDPDELRGRLRQGCQSTGDFQRILMESICEQQRATRWADCTPDNVLHMHEIKASFPDALFIHIIRDGRDVSLSLAAQDWVSPLPWNVRKRYLPAAAYWEWIVENGRKLGPRLGADYMEVHYGQLVQEPTETLSELAKFVGQDLNYSRILETGIGSVRRPNSSFADSKNGQSSPVRRWERVLNRDEIRLMERFIGRQLTELGYDIGTDGARLSVGGALSRFLYRRRFEVRSWLKHRTVLGRWFGDSSLLEVPSRVDTDRTLRPGENLDYVRQLVSR